MNDNRYDKITGFNLWEIILYCFEKNSFVVFVTIFIVAVLMIIFLRILFKKTGVDKYFTLEVLSIVVLVVSLIVVIIYMIVAPHDMKDDRIEGNVISKYDITGAHLTSTVSKDEGIYLLKLFDRDSMRVFTSEVWFDPMTNEPSAKSNSRFQEEIKSFSENIVEK